MFHLQFFFGLIVGLDLDFNYKCITHNNERLYLSTLFAFLDEVK